MAEALFRMEIAGTELGKKFRAASCGVEAIDGESASINAQRALAEIGVDLSAHRSRRISQEILDKTRVLVALTQEHFDEVSALFSQLPPHVFTISLPDPFGATIDGYRAARDATRAALPQLIEFLKNLPDEDQ